MKLDLGWDGSGSLDEECYGDGVEIGEGLPKILISDSDHGDSPLARGRAKELSEGSLGGDTPELEPKKKKKKRRKSTFVVKPIPEGDDDLRLMRENLMGIYKCCDN